MVEIEIQAEDDQGALGYASLTEGAPTFLLET